VSRDEGLSVSHPAENDLQHSVTRLLARVQDGDQAAFHKLLPLVYAELRILARAQRRRWDGDETLNTTALVHEAYLRLVDQGRPGWKDRAHFLAAASQAMRHILIDYARRRTARKRGGPLPPLALHEIEEALGGSTEAVEAGDEALLALEEALRRLEAENPRQAWIVECRFFGGMTIPETAEALAVSPATVTRGWAAAQAWLYREIRRSLESAP
jgi:RNA polymerase sigma factor (TIGR02999 family)